MVSQHNFIAVRYTTKGHASRTVIDRDSSLGVDNIHG